jgi:hypothetical protein
VIQLDANVRSAPGGSGQSLRDVPRVRHTPAAYDYPRTGFGKRLRHRRAEMASGAGDERDFSSQT